MRNILLLGHQQLKGFLRDRTSLIWLLAMPLAFTYFMGYAVRGPGGPVDPRPLLRLDNQDTGFVGRLLVDRLATNGLRFISPTNLDQRVPTLTIPSNLTVRVEGRQETRMPYRPDAEPGDQAAALTELRVVRAFVDANALLVEHALKDNAGADLNEASLRELLEAPSAVELQVQFAGRRPIPSSYNLSVPGNLVMYLMLNLLVFGGATVASERRSGVLRRLVIHPVTHLELVTGKIYGMLLLGVIQTAVLLLVGQFVFQVDIGQSLVPITLTLLIYAWVASSLGVLIGSLTVSEDKIVGLCVLLSLVMAALGGCWWPLELVPDWMKLAAHAVPTGWAMDALHQLISFGGGWEKAKGAVGVLVLYGLGANLLAARFFRY